MANQQVTVACPGCKSAKHATRRADGDFWCNRCKALYDENPDEGGDHSDFNPAARLERADRAAQHHSNRRF